MEEEWELVDIMGEYSAWTMAPSTNTLVHAIGSQIIIWNLDTDQKVHIRCHENEVSCILFDSTGEFFLTAEKSNEPFLSLWSFESLSQCAVKFLPAKLRKNSMIKIEMCAAENFLIVLEVEKDQGYRVTRWEWNGSNLEYLDLFNLENKERAFKVEFINSEFFFTSEKQFIKIWENGKTVHLSKRLYFKSDIIDVSYSSELSAFALLLGTHSFIIVNSSGQIITNFTETYSSFCIYSDFLFLGGRSLQVYSLKNYALVSDTLESELQITKVLVNGGNLACVTYENSTTQVVDLEKNAILKAVAYHGTSVHSFVWNIDGNFTTAGEESSVYLWSKLEAGWGLEALQLSSDQVSAVDMNGGILAVGFVNGLVCTFNEEFSLLNSVKISNTKIEEVKLTRSGILFAKSGKIVMMEEGFGKVSKVICAEGKGISFCELTDGRESLILICTLADDRNAAVHRVSKKEVVKALGFTNVQLDSKCESFVLHTSGKYLIACLDIGCICLYDIYSSTLIGVIENSGTLSIDLSGLYLCCLAKGSSCKVFIYEVGTGELVSEMGRIPNALQVYFSFDGKLVGLTSTTGKIEIWKLPEVVRYNISKMLNRGEDDIWEKFPIMYENKSIKVRQKTTKIPEEALLNNTAFKETVVSLVQRPEKRTIREPVEIPNIRPPEVLSEKPKISKLYMPTAKQEVFSFSLNNQTKKPEPKPETHLDSPVSFSSNKKKTFSIDRPISLCKPRK